MRLRGIAMLVAVIAILLLIFAGLGTRIGLWNFRFGIGMLRWAAYFGIAGVVLTLIALAIARPRGAGTVALVIALVLSAVAFLLPWQFAQKAKRVPVIHDITTDTQDPPQFLAVLPLRARSGAENSATYGGDSVAALQRQGYPDIRPLHLDIPPAAAYARALATLTAMGLDTVATDSAAGRIEATATTKWFGFHDDVVVRVRPDSTGSRVDVRSESRVGTSDLGTNAARVRTFLSRLAGS